MMTLRAQVKETVSVSDDEKRTGLRDFGEARVEAQSSYVHAYGCFAAEEALPREWR